MKRIAVYAGTFDPITTGHCDITRRAAQLFDEVILAVAEETYKETMFTLAERKALAEAALADVPNIRVETFSGMLVDYCGKVGASAIVRGLRAVSDFDKEFQMALMNRDFAGGVETVFLMSDAAHLYISSSLVRNIAAAGGSYAHLVPPTVAEAVAKKLSR